MATFCHGRPESVLGMSSWLLCCCRQSEHWSTMFEMPLVMPGYQYNFWVRFEHLTTSSCSSYRNCGREGLINIRMRYREIFIIMPACNVSLFFNCQYWAAILGGGRDLICSWPPVDNKLLQGTLDGIIVWGADSCSRRTSGAGTRWMRYF